MAKDVLTTGQVARWCQVSLKTVHRWIELGELKAYKLPGRGDHRITLEEFQAFLGAHGMPVPDAVRQLAAAKAAPRVLVIEDDERSARLASAALTADGADVRVASDGLSAGALLVEFNPAVVVVDLGLPGLGGRDVIRIIRSMPRCAHTGILVVSGAEVPELENAVAMGADRYLQKPVDPVDLQAAVRDLLASRTRTSST